MEVTQRLRISSKELFEFISNGIKEDVLNNIDNISETINLEKLEINKGFQYTKLLKSYNKKHNKEMKVTINEFIPNNQFEISFKSKDSVHWIKYYIEEMDQGINVTYSEDFIKEKQKRRWTDVFFPKPKLKNRKMDLKANLLGIEKKILKQREN